MGMIEHASGAVSELIECVPNFSEGRRRQVVDAIVSAMAAVAGVRVLDWVMDANHNRAVVTLAGDPWAVCEAAFRGVREAATLIDMSQHSGQHPRVGAADVVPLVPLRGVTMDRCMSLARSLGRRIGDDLGIPVYLYGEAALRPERRDLPSLRRGEYEGLREVITTDSDREPDYGPAKIGTAGATVVGARWPLIAFNVNLRSRDLRVARSIARSIRESSGGMPAVRALALDLPDLGAVQVSMNLTDFHRTSVLQAFDAVEGLARAAGFDVMGSELVGLVPEEALPPDAVGRLKLTGFSPDQTLERRLAMA
jgi:glutamate formiminotransferase